MDEATTTIFPRILAGGRFPSFFAQKGGRLFEILLSGSRALNILLDYPIKSKNDRIKKTEHRLSKCSKFSSLISFQCQYPRWKSLNRQ